jgi:hypothetical protein
VWVFRHGKKNEVLNRIEMARPIRSTPTAANGVLYIATESQLYAIAK